MSDRPIAWSPAPRPSFARPQRGAAKSPQCVIPLKQLTKAGRLPREKTPFVVVVKGKNHADSHNSICFGSRRWGAYLRRNDRTNSLTKRDSSPALMITDVSNHNDVSESGLTTTPSAWRVRAVG